MDYLSLSLMFTIHNKTAPEYLCNIEPVCHNYRTRKSNISYVIPHVKSQGSKTFKYNAIKLWNDLPNSIKCSDSKDTFKTNCKTFLMNKMSNAEQSEYVM